MKAFKKSWIFAGVAVVAISLISAGVFAATQITINGNNVVRLGAGSASVSACGSTATVAFSQIYDSTAQAYKTSTVSVTGLPSACGGKTLQLAFKQNSTTYSATWSVPVAVTSADTFAYGYGGSGGSYNAGGTTLAQSTFSAFDTAGSDLSTVAISVQ